MGVSFQRTYKVGLASATSANGTARNGASLAVNDVHPGTLSAQCTVTIVTGSVVCTWKPQVSMDATTWYDLKTLNNAAAVTSTADATLCLEVPWSQCAGWMYFRMAATLSGASTAAGDLTAVTYRYVPQGQMPFGQG